MEIQLESISKLHIQNKIKRGDYNLVWSFVLDFENSLNPKKDNKKSIQIWKNISKMFCKSSTTIYNNAKLIESYNIKTLDALHITCAISSECKYFITTDKLLIKKKAMSKIPWEK
jgi:predicted nucleic acid-binding protein